MDFLCLGAGWLVLVAACILVLALLYNAFWAIVERLYPFTYRHVAIECVREHIAQFWRRAMDGAQMVIAQEKGGVRIVLEKRLTPGSQQVWMRIRCEVPHDLTHCAEDILRRLRESRIACVKHRAYPVGIPGAQYLTCDRLMESERVNLAVDTLLRGACGEACSAVFSVRTRGKILNVDMQVTGATSYGDIWRAGLSKEYKIGIPYEWHQCVRSDRVGWVLGRALGALLSRRQSR